MYKDATLMHSLALQDKSQDTIDATIGVLLDDNKNLVFSKYFDNALKQVSSKVYNYAPVDGGALFKQTIADLLDYSDFNKFINMGSIAKDIDKLDSIDVDLCMFDKYAKESEQLKRLFSMADRITFQAIEAFVHNLNTMHSRAGAQVPFSSINFGTDVSLEGRMVTKNYLLAVDKGLGHAETPIFPISIFKVKEGVNYNPGDPNYDLKQLAIKSLCKRIYPNFVNCDFSGNVEDITDPDTYMATMGCRTRVFGNRHGEKTSIGRGNLSFTTINLPRLGIKYGIALGERDKADMKGFYEELGETMDKVRDQLLERFEVQCNKRCYNFPFLLGQGVWTNGEKLKPTDRLRKVWKHGSLSTGFIGLAECLKALTGKHHGESKSSQELGLEIIKFMRNKLF